MLLVRKDVDTDEYIVTVSNSSLKPWLSLAGSEAIKAARDRIVAWSFGVEPESGIR